jgi:hypothetical protein
VSGEGCGDVLPIVLWCMGYPTGVGGSGGCWAGEVNSNRQFMSVLVCCQVKTPKPSSARKNIKSILHQIA